MRTKCHFNKVALENEREFKYLGFMLMPSGEINLGLQNLRDRALKDIYKLKTSIGDFSKPTSISPSTFSTL